jgi:hypothetical protein
LPEVKEDIQMAPRRLNLENWKRGLYCLKKEPTGFRSNNVVIGIDPGILRRQISPLLICLTFLFYIAIGFRSMVTAVNTSGDDVKDKASTKAHSFSVSNSEYK